MNKKKITKIATICVLIIFAIFIIFNIRKAIISGKQKIEIVSGNSYYAGSTLEASISTIDYHTEDKLSSKIKVNLLNSNHKKVKNVNSEIKTEENQTGNLKLDLPEDLETGKYYIQVNSKSKKGNDTVEKQISIIGNHEENINISLDKGIYKPGDTVKYRVLLTSKGNDEPNEEEIEISIYDGNDNRVYKEKAKTSEFGITSGSFTLASEVNSGTYKIKVLSKTQEYSKSFTVNPYITPQFDTEIKTQKDNYLVNDKIKITVNSKYFFGEPVKNAKVILKINDEEQEGLTNQEGIFEYEYLAKESKTLKINAEVTDESNYLVEASKTIYVTEDIFELEVLPEYGKIIDNIDNDIYFFTKNPDGSGKKTYITVSMGDKFSRQVITDDQGVGVLHLSKSDISSIVTTSSSTSKSTYRNYSNISTTSNLDFKIQAKDMDGNTISKNKQIEIIKNTGTLIKTDKVKYNQEDDIKITLNCANEIKNQTIAICKNSEIIKLITTNDENVTVNLDNNYGIIDIYVLNNKTYSSKSNIQNKRTIFIKPSKKLNIQIETDKQEYSPKDNMNITLNLTDENGKTVDGALLISALDEAVLKVADNDLSIDNIKMALSDIKFSNELDAATAYTNIIDDQSESTLMAILLKQDSKQPNITTNRYNTSEEKDAAIQRIIIGTIVFAIILLIYFSIKFEIFRKILTSIIAFIGSLFAILTIIFALTDEFYYIDFEPSLIIGLIATIILYVTLLNKIKKSIARITIEYLTIGIMIIITALILNYFESNIRWVILALEIVLFPLMLIISHILIKKNIKTNIIKKLNFISKEMLKAIIITALTVLSGIVGIIFAIIVFIILNIIYEIKFVKESKTEEKKIENKEKSVAIGIAIGIIIGMIAIGFILLCITMLIGDNGVLERSSVIDDGYYIEESPSINRDTTTALDSIDSAQSSTKSSPFSLFESSNGILAKAGKGQEDIGEQVTNTEENIIAEQSENNQYQEENIRNIFLESLCFIPDLITTSGKGETNITLSDNITRWKIQVVGNTKNGNIGYNSSNITVKKDFFADFSLPTNSIIGDEIQIPLTIYNYTENTLKPKIEITSAKWFTLGNFETEINIEPASTKMIYIPITILKDGENSLKVKVTAENDIQDILQKTMTVKNKGLEVTNVVSSGSIDKNMSQDIIYDANAIEGTKNLKIKLYPSTISQIVEGLENIFRMPTGCFEQTSSSLYPDVMVLKYMQKTGIINNTLREKALGYISSGYQRLLTFEVRGEKGGYSLYGKSPANPSLTAYGLMELTDLSTVYDIDTKVTDDMKNYLYGRQKTNGSFNIGDTYYSSHVISKMDDMTLNAYIIWALSEADSKDDRLSKSINYLENNLDKLTDSYTIALATNAFANVGDSKNANILTERLLNKVTNLNNLYYLQSDVMDCYGTKGNIQNLQTTALTSMALSKTSTNSKANAMLIDYIISRKDSYGTWGTTQATILCLKALVEYQTKSDIGNQTINIKLNNEVKTIDIKEDALDIYEVIFENLNTENSLNIEMQKGKIYYEIIEDYYQDAEILKENSSNKIDVTSSITNKCKVNDIVTQNIQIKNISGDFIKNGMVEISIPQGFTVQEETLSKLVTNKVIQKYEYNYSKIYIYVQDIENQDQLTIDVNYRAKFPGKITGGSIRVYDYYNPEVEGISIPTEIEIQK